MKAYATRVGEGRCLRSCWGRAAIASATAARIRIRHRAAPPMRMVRRRRGALRGADQRSRQRGMTKLDVLDGLDRSRCARDTAAGASDPRLAGGFECPRECEPVYETLPGWSRPTSGVTRYDDLPREAQRYIAFLEETTGLPVSIVSTGSGRNDTIVREKSAAAEWFGVGAT